MAAFALGAALLLTVWIDRADPVVIHFWICDADAVPTLRTSPDGAPLGGLRAERVAGGLEHVHARLKPTLMQRLYRLLGGDVAEREWIAGRWTSRSSYPGWSEYVVTFANDGRLLGAPVTTSMVGTWVSGAETMELEASGRAVRRASSIPLGTETMRWGHIGDVLVVYEFGRAGDTDAWRLREALVVEGCTAHRRDGTAFKLAATPR